MITSKQVIVMRKDLNMRKGKMIAQGAHASMAALLNRSVIDGNNNSLLTGIPVGSPLKDWIEGRFTKICVGVDSEDELIEIYNKAMELGFICSMITDAGLTEFGGVPTKTCCAIGPEWSNEIDLITGHLKLL